VIGALARPGRTFRAIAERPTWVPPLAVLLGCGLVLFFLVAERTDFEEITREALAQQGRQLDEAKVAQIAGLQRGFGWLFQLVATPLLYGGAALVLWVTFKLLGGELDYQQSLGATLHALLPTALASLLSIPAILARRELHLADLQTGVFLPSSLLALAPEDSSEVVRTLLASFDLFSLWAVALLVVGFQLAAKVSRGMALAAVVFLWLVYILGRVGLAAVGA
jgi:hypothetical protein